MIIMLLVRKIYLFNNDNNHRLISIHVLYIAYVYHVIIIGPDLEDLINDDEEEEEEEVHEKKRLNRKSRKRSI